MRQTRLKCPFFWQKWHFSSFAGHGRPSWEPPQFLHEPSFRPWRDAMFGFGPPGGVGAPVAFFFPPLLSPGPQWYMALTDAAVFCSTALTFDAADSSVRTRSTSALRSLVVGCLNIALRASWLQVPRTRAAAT